MPAPTTTPAAGTTLTRGTALLNVTSIKGGGIEVGERNTTNLASTWKSCRPILPKAKKLTSTVQYLAAAHVALVAEAAAGTITSTVLTFPDSDGGADGGTLTFSAFISALEYGGMDEDGTVTMDIEFTPVETVTAA